MALKPQLSFSSGELDPILQDRVTLERFQNALATARNTMIGKTGTVLSRFSTVHFAKARYDNEPIKIFSPHNSGVVIEFGISPHSQSEFAQYITMHTVDGATPQTFYGFDEEFMFRKEDLDNLHFVPSGEYVYVFGGYDVISGGERIFRIKYTQPYSFTLHDELFKLPIITGESPWNISGNGTGYDIDYSFTVMFEGQESANTEMINLFTTAKKPMNVSEKNQIITILFDSPDEEERNKFLARVNAVYIYSRPKEGSAYGFLGKTTQIYVEGTEVRAKYVDLGSNPDYGQNPPTLVSLERLSSLPDIGDHAIKTGTVYQQRFILANFKGINKEAILASRPGFHNNFYRDYPYFSDSALNFKAGTTGNAEVLRMIDSDGLVVFTTIGPYVSVGPLSPSNLSLDKRGGWVIDERIPPLSIPGGLFFVDKTTNTVRHLQYSQEVGSYISNDQSIFSDHLFKDKLIKSWTYQDGAAQLIIVTFSDGSFATFTYDIEHQLKAWTRHDSKFPIEQVEGSGMSDVSFFVVNKNGTRYIDMTVPRYVSTGTKISVPESDLLSFGAFMDSMKVSRFLVNDMLESEDYFSLIPVVPDDWSGDLRLFTQDTELTGDMMPLDVGRTFRIFNPVDLTHVDLEVISIVSNLEVIVAPSEEYPSDYSTNFRLYGLNSEVLDLGHLEGEEVSVMCDGGVIGSPNNDNEGSSFRSYKVIGGSISLPEPAAIVIVGRPITSDVKTLNVSTVEQSPTMIESMTVNKLYMKCYESRGLYIANNFPEEEVGETDGHSVKGMQSLDSFEVPEGKSYILGNRVKPKNTKRMEVILTGDWSNQGQVSIRQVDPVHFEIMSIIADIEILRR